MNGYIFLNETKYSVFVDQMTANFQSDCVAHIQTNEAVDGWLSLSNGVEYLVRALYIDFNGKLRLTCRMAGQEAVHTSTVDIYQA